MSGNEVTSISPWAPRSGSMPSSEISSGSGLRTRHRPRRHATHHHALEHGLTPDGGVALGDECPVGQALRGGHVRSYERAPRLAARRLKRSTRPPVSTSFWRPV